MVGKWIVAIPQGRWMAGPNRFSTKAKAVAFIERWNAVEANAGKHSLQFMRSGPNAFEPVAL